MNFLWTDIETTGLDPRRDQLLQLGMIVTTPVLEEVARIEWVLHCDLPIETWEAKVADMHRASGLYEKALASPVGLGAVAWAARGFVQAYGGEQPVMAGNSVHFDKYFLEAQMPLVTSLMHYRLLDISVFKVLREAWGLERQHGKPAHTALADLDACIADFRQVKALFFPGVGPELVCARAAG